jgi:putative transposase
VVGVISAPVLGVLTSGKDGFKSRVGEGVMRGRRSGCKPVKCPAYFWQRRYWEHHIRDESDFAAHMRYCWINPVKHGLVARTVDWPFSSIHRDIRRGMVEPEWSGELVEGAFGERERDGG